MQSQDEQNYELLHRLNMNFLNPVRVKYLNSQISVIQFVGKMDITRSICNDG